MYQQPPRKKMLRRAGFTLLILISGVSDCWACYSPPPTMLIGVDEQIRGATDISVAKVERASAAHGVATYEFVVKRRLAGLNQESFTLVGSDNVRLHKDTSFDHHQAAIFWKRGGGRLINGGDCLIHPTFVVGESYLVFRGQPLTWRSAEKIETVDGSFDQQDKWLQYVEAKLQALKQPAP